MSQVKIQKMQQGGSFRMNGRELLGQEAIDKLTPLLGETTAGISRAIEQGKIVNYNPADNTIYVTDDKGSDLTLQYLPAVEGMNPTDSRLRRNLRATFNTSKHQAALDLDKLRHVDMIGAAAEDTPPTTLLRRGKGWFAYHTNEDGTKTYIQDHQGNADKLSILKMIEDYYNGTDEDRKKYSTGDWTQSQLDEFGNYYKTISDHKAYWQGLIQRIQSNQLKESDIYTLKSFGFSPDEVEESTISTKLSIDPDWKGNRAASERAGIGWKKDKDGRWQIIGDASNQFVGSNWYLDGLDWTPDEYKTGFLLNGKLYREDEVYNNPDFADILDRWYSAPRKNKNWREWYDAVNNSGIRFVNDRIWNGNPNPDASNYYGAFTQTFNPSTEYNPYLYQYFTTNNITGDIPIADITSHYTNLGNKRVFAYLNPLSAWNSHGVPQASYLIYDPDSENSYLTDISGLTPNIYSGEPTSLDITTWVPGKKGMQYALHKKIGTVGRENAIYIGNDGNYYLGKNNGNGETVNGNRIYNTELLEKILADPTNPEWDNPELERLLINTNEPYVSGTVVKTSVPKDTPLQSVLNSNIRLRKEGGDLPKLQYGGGLKNSVTSKQTTDTKDAKTDIIKSHALDGSDGGLTEVEWMQIGAAIGDVAGVGVSFIPEVGNIAGATTGAIASTTKFIADIKQDGYQGKDLTHYIGNLLLDTATLIPIAGTGIKAAKVARIIRSVGKPLIKWLSIAGAAAPVITAVEKISNGEKYTSADLTEAIRGIGAGIIATKSIKDSIGNAKLASSLKGKALDSINSNAAKTIRVGQYTDTSTPEDILKFIEANPTEKAAIEGIIGDAKSKGVELSREDAYEVLDKLGITINKGKLSRNPLKWGKSSTRRAESTVEYKPIKEEAHSWAYYALLPGKRADVLGSEAVFGFGKKPGIVSENVTGSEIRAAIKAKNPTLEQQALMRMTAENPQAFGYLFENRGHYKPSSSKSGWYFGGNRYYRLPKMERTSHGPKSLVPEVVEPTNIVTVEPKTIPQNFVIPETRMLNSSVQNTAGLLPAPTYGPETFRGIRYEAPKKADNRFVVLEPTGFVMKKGGKIQKAQFGTQLIGNNLIKKEYQTPDIPYFDPNRFIYDPNYKMPNLSASWSKLDPTNPYTKPVDYLAITQTSFDIPSPTLDSISNTEDTNNEITKVIIPKGTKPGQTPQFNLPNIDDTIRAGLGYLNINKDIALQKSALDELYKRQFQTPELDRMKYNFSDLEQGFNESQKPYLDSRFVTSDPRDSMAFNLSRAQQLSALAGQKNAQVSQRINQVNETNRQIDNQNLVNRVQTANEKSQYMTGLNYQRKMLDSVRLNRQWSDIIAPFGQQMSQQGRDAWNEVADSTYKTAITAARDDYNNKIAQLPEVAKLKTEYAGSEQSKTISFDDWLELDSTRMKRYNDAIAKTRLASDYQNAVRQAAENRMRQRGTGWGLRTLWMRTGGNLRSAQEQIAINHSKAAKRSIDELSKALLKMLQQLTK